MLPLHPKADLDGAELDLSAIEIELDVPGAEHVDVVGAPAFDLDSIRQRRARQRGATPSPNVRTA